MVNWEDLAKVAIPAIGAWAVAWLKGYREHRQWLEGQEARQQEALLTQSDRLAAGWSDMTTQAREIIHTLTAQAAQAKAEAAAARERVDELQKENRELAARLKSAAESTRDKPVS